VSIGEIYFLFCVGVKMGYCATAKKKKMGYCDWLYCNSKIFGGEHDPSFLWIRVESISDQEISKNDSFIARTREGKMSKRLS
jgi:hypothetical protein